MPVRQDVVVDRSTVLARGTPRPSRPSVRAPVGSPDSSTVGTPSAGSPPLPTTSTGPSLPVRAPDGMERNAVVDAPQWSRLDIVEAAKTAPVPQRIQIGPTCGLYALGMVMDAWNARDPKHPTALVQDADVPGVGKQYTRPPTTGRRMLDVARTEGFTAVGEMFTARQLAALARHFGYDATTHEDATLADLYAVLDAGHPAIVAFDVDPNGNPTAQTLGERAHYAVIQGYFDDGGTRYLIARHGWGVQRDHVWKADDFDASWKSLRTTTFYGTPGDGTIPTQPGIGEPALLDLPDAGGGRAHIVLSLRTKIVEVVPRGEAPVGGTR